MYTSNVVLGNACQCRETAREKNKSLPDRVGQANLRCKALLFELAWLRMDEHLRMDLGTDVQSNQFCWIQYMNTQQQKPKGKGKDQKNQRKGQNPNRLAPSMNLPRDARPQKAPAASSKLMVSSKPKIVADSNSKRVVHRELLGSLVGSANFAVARQISLNPGLYSSFPWLSTESLGWETYKFNSLRFEYVTRTGTGIPGSVILTTDYDASDAPPGTEQIAANYCGAHEDAPWKDIQMDLNPAALHGLGPRKFIRYGALSANEDIKTYDSGNFFLCTLDGTAVPWGKLWVTYDVSFFTPQMASTTVLTSGLQLESANPTTAAPFGATPTIVSGGPPYVSVAGGVITFSVPGQYVVDYRVDATVAAYGGAVGSAGATIQYSVDVGSGGALFLSHSIWQITSAGATVTVSNTITAGTHSHLLVAALPSSPIF